MKLQEHQSKRVFASYGVPIPDGGVAATPAEARLIAERLGGTVVVKAQVLVGGRGKAGGIKVVRSAADVESVAARNQLLFVLPSTDEVRIVEAEVLERCDGLSRTTVKRVLERLQDEDYVTAEEGYGKRKTAFGYALTEEGEKLRDILSVRIEEAPEHLEFSPRGENTLLSSPPSINGQYESAKDRVGA